jgi:hypothetical protein
VTPLPGLLLEGEHSAQEGPLLVLNNVIGSISNHRTTTELRDEDGTDIKEY